MRQPPPGAIGGATANLALSRHAICRFLDRIAPEWTWDRARQWLLDHIEEGRRMVERSTDDAEERYLDGPEGLPAIVLLIKPQMIPDKDRSFVVVSIARYTGEHEKYHRGTVGHRSYGLVNTAKAPVAKLPRVDREALWEEEQRIRAEVQAERARKRQLRACAPSRSSTVGLCRTRRQATAEQDARAVDQVVMVDKEAPGFVPASALEALKLSLLQHQHLSRSACALVDRLQGMLVEVLHMAPLDPAMDLEIRSLLELTPSAPNLEGEPAWPALVLDF